MNKPDCKKGEGCRSEVTCTPETCPYGQTGWKHTVHCIKHICAHDFQSGPWVEGDNFGTGSCSCGLTAMDHDMRWAP